MPLFSRKSDTSRGGNSSRTSSVSSRNFDKNFSRTSRGNFAQNANRGAYNSRISHAQDFAKSSNRGGNSSSFFAKNSSNNFAKTVRNAGAARSAKIAATEIKSALFDQSGALKLSRKHRPDYAIVILILLLAITGLVVLFSIAPALNSGDQSKTNAFMFKQGIFLALGIATFFIFSRIPLDFWRKYGSRIFILALAVCFFVAIPHFPLALNINGAQRWFDLGFIGTFQPAEFLKFGLVVFSSGFLAIKSSRNQLNSWRALAPFLALVVISLGVVVGLQKDMGTGLAMFAIFLVQLIVAGVSWRKIFLIVAAAGAIGVFMIILEPHRLDRIATFTGSGDEHQNYQIDQALIAIGSGGFAGRGLGQSVQAYGWLPENSTDAIFAIVGETLGFVGVVAIICAFALLLRRIIAKVDYTENLFLRLILAGVFGWLAAHVALNIGAMTSLIPLTGVTLPLISFGGTSMMFIMASLGVVFAISGYTTHRKISRDETFSRNPENSRTFQRRRV